MTTLALKQIKPDSATGSASNTGCLIGLGTLDERILILVDIDYLMTSTEMRRIKKPAA